MYVTDLWVTQLKSSLYTFCHLVYTECGKFRLEKQQTKHSTYLLSTRKNIYLRKIYVKLTSFVFFNNCLSFK